jgi:hypothetical protein
MQIGDYRPGTREPGGEFWISALKANLYSILPLKKSAQVPLGVPGSRNRNPSGDGAAGLPDQ